MKSLISGYMSLLLLILNYGVSLAFVSINLNVSEAVKLYSEYNNLVQETDGAIITTLITERDSNIQEIDSGKSWLITFNCSVSVNNENGQVKYSVVKTDKTKSNYYYVVINKETDNESDSRFGQTFIYNNVYSINLVYYYTVNLIGEQHYSVGGVTL